MRSRRVGSLQATDGPLEGKMQGKQSQAGSKVQAPELRLVPDVLCRQDGPCKRLNPSSQSCMQGTGKRPGFWCPVVGCCKPGVQDKLWRCLIASTMAG